MILGGLALIIIAVSFMIVGLLFLAGVSKGIDTIQRKE